MADTTNINRKSENEAMREAIEKYGAIELIDLDNGVQLIARSTDGRGRELVSVKKFLDEYLTAPERRTGTATMTTLESFIAHAKRFADKGSAIFASTSDPKSPKLTAVLDYHGPGAQSEPRFGVHRTKYMFPLSDEWTAWTARNGMQMEQSTFAEFLETRLIDIMPPEEAQDRIKGFVQRLGIKLASPQRLLELSRGLSIRMETNVTNSQVLSTGETRLVFSEEAKDESGAPLNVPNGFGINIPFFKNGPLYQIPVRLRLKKVGAKITWTMLLSHVELVWDDAIRGACETVAKETGLPLMFGSPEE
jgi:uncharacterized protein YfdQ (DUF2303 family)